MVCTGNAARSPMAAAMLRDLDAAGRIDVRSAGILALEGHPMSARTRSALARHGLVDHAHRSRQFRSTDAAEADLVVVMEPLHLTWMRRNLPEVAPITGSLQPPGHGSLAPPQTRFGIRAISARAVKDPGAGRAGAGCRGRSWSIPARATSSTSTAAPTNCAYLWPSCIDVWRDGLAEAARVGSGVTGWMRSVVGVWRKAPLLVVVAVAMVATAGLRALA